MQKKNNKFKTLTELRKNRIINVKICENYVKYIYNKNYKW